MSATTTGHAGKTAAVLPIAGFKDLYHVTAVESALQELPNFSEVLEDIRKQLALCIDSATHFVDEFVELPIDASGARRIARTIYCEIRNGHDWGSAFPELPSETLLEKLSAYGPREMRRVIQSGFGNAKLAGRVEISPDDIQDKHTARRQRIGF